MSNEDFPLNQFKTNDGTEALVHRCWQQLGHWRKFIFAIDGRDGAGKTVLGRYLSYRLNMPCIETDLYLLRNKGLNYRRSLGSIINQRLRRDSPLIIEGIFAADILDRLNLRADYLIRVSQAGVEGSGHWQDAFKAYEARFKPDEHV